MLTLTGPATLPASIPDGLGVVQHTFSNTFTGYIPATWVKTGLQVTVNAGAASTTIINMKVGAPTRVIMTMTDVQYFSDTNSDYPAGTFAGLEVLGKAPENQQRRLLQQILRRPPVPHEGMEVVRHRGLVGGPQAHEALLIVLVEHI